MDSFPEKITWMNIVDIWQKCLKQYYQSAISTRWSIHCSWDQFFIKFSSTVFHLKRLHYNTQPRQWNNVRESRFCKTAETFMISPTLSWFQHLVLLSFEACFAPENSSPCCPLNLVARRWAGVTEGKTMVSAAERCLTSTREPSMRHVLSYPSEHVARVERMLLLVDMTEPLQPQTWPVCSTAACSVSCRCWGMVESSPAASTKPTSKHPAPSAGCRVPCRWTFCPFTQNAIRK